MIKVLYDSYSFDREDVGGVTRYFSEIIRHFPKDRARAIVTTCESHNLYVQEEPFHIPRPECSFRSFLPKISIVGKYRLYRFLSRYFAHFVPGCEEGNRRAFLKAVKEEDFDVVHLTGLGYDWRNVVHRKPLVVTIHDLIPELVNKDKQYDRMRRDLYAAANHIIAVSEHTRQDAISFYGIAPDRITTIYHGMTQSSLSVGVPELDGARYVLYVGKRGGYKNFAFFAGALSRVMAHDSSLRLVCTGAAFSRNEQDLLRSLGVWERTTCRRFSDGEMRWLFEHAQVFVYPSLYEGFGLPILDAFSASCPVLLARASCFPEVAGEAALYFDPHDASDLQCKLLELLDGSPELAARRAKLVERGRERCGRFSWERCARETVGIYEKAVAEFGR